MLSVLPSEFHKTCRLCLLINEHVNVDIFEHKDIHYKMIACLPITISSGDKLPPKICFECRNKVNAFYDFWDQARVSEKRLLSCSRTESQAISLDIIRNEDTTSVQNSRLDESESKKATVQVDYCEKVGYASLSEVNSGFEQLQGLGEELIYLYVEPEETEQNVNQMGSSTDKFHDPNSSNQFNFIVDMCTDDVNITESADDPQINSYSVEFPKCGRSIYRSKSSKKRKLAQSSNKEQLESYMCSICDISFSDKVDYHRHEVTHYVDYPYECALCGEHFKRSKQLDNHKSFRHMENWFSSSDKEMVDDDNLVNDVIIADEKNTLDCSNETLSSERMCCEICAKVFESQTSCEIHMKKHDLEDVIVCELCGRQFSASKNHRCTKIHFSGSDVADNVLKKLVWVGEHKASYEIRQDDEGDDDHESRDDLKRIKKLRLKLRKSTTSDVASKKSNVNGGKCKRNVATKSRSSEDDIFKCSHCDEQFDTSIKRNRHEKNRHSKHQIKYDCDKCSYSTYTKGCFTTHLKRHIKQYNLFCKECNLGFFNNTELTSHNIKSHDMQPFQCAICNDMFTSKGNLYSHIKSHDPNNSYVCEICGRTYKKKNSYKRHITRSHLGLTTKAQCLVCEKVLSSKEHLRRHMLTHTDERNWVCSTCGKCFLSKTYLTEHSRIHLGIRPYKCEICEKSFTQRGSLTIHKRSHTGERPFRCEYCNKGFVMSTLLRYHLRKCGEAKLGTHFFSHSVISTAPATQEDLSSKMENVRAVFGDKLEDNNVIAASEMDPLNNCTVIHSTN